MEVAVAFDKKQSIQKCMITMEAAQCKARTMVHQFSMGFNAMKVSEISYGELKGPKGHHLVNCPIYTLALDVAQIGTGRLRGRSDNSVEIIPSCLLAIRS